MSDQIPPTEEYDGRITVRLLDDKTNTEEIRCTSYDEAISVVKEHQYDVTTAKIVARDDEVVFTSTDMDIDTWESIWRNEKRRLSVDVEDHDCSYDSISCFADDLCIQCQIDKVQEQY